jgi:hypothetical protein
VSFTFQASIDITSAGGAGSTEIFKILLNGGDIGSSSINMSGTGITGVVVNTGAAVVQGDIVTVVADSTSSSGEYTVLSGAVFASA